MATFEILLALVAFCVLLALLAQRLHLPVAVPLVLGGMVLAFVPGLPVVELNPELALALFLPPLLPVNPRPQSRVSRNCRLPHGSDCSHQKIRQNPLSTVLKMHSLRR